MAERIMNVSLGETSNLDGCSIASSKSSMERMVASWVIAGHEIGVWSWRDLDALEVTTVVAFYAYYDYGRHTAKRSVVSFYEIVVDLCTCCDHEEN